MNPAFLREPTEATRTLVFAFCDGAGRMRVADRRVALLNQRMVRQFILAHVLANVLTRPTQNRMDLIQPVLLLHCTQRSAMVRLVCTQSREPGGHIEFFQCPLQRFNLEDVVVVAQALGIFPCLAMQRLVPGWRDAGGIHHEVQFEPLGEVLDQFVGLRKQVAGVDQDDRQVGDNPCDQVQHHRRLGAKTGSHRQPIPEGLSGPADNLRRGFAVEQAIGRIELEGCTGSQRGGFRWIKPNIVSGKGCMRRFGESMRV